MRVLGIDPGIATTGVALIEEENGRLTLIESCAIITPPHTDNSYRLEMIHQKLTLFLKATTPDVAAMESLYFKTNVTTAFTVGQARGVIQLALSQNRIPIAEYSPAQIKISLTGYGKADKKQMQMMVKQVLKLPEILKPDDVADAGAIALTHCFSYKLEKLKTKG